MTAKRQNFEIFIGDDADILVTVYDEDGDLLTITGATITWVMKTAAGGAAILTKTVGSGIVISGSTFTITLTDTETALLTAGSYFHAASVTISTKTRTTTVGQVTVSAR